jgi:hypothetical protein
MNEILAAIQSKPVIGAVCLTKHWSVHPGARGSGSVVVKALCYKPEDRGFGPDEVNV